MLLTEDKKAIKKKHNSKNKVRFKLEKSLQSSCSESNYNQLSDVDDSNELILRISEKKQSSIDSDSSQSLEKCGEILFESIQRDDYFDAMGANQYLKNRTFIEQKNYILHVILENKTVKSFKYDFNTCVRDVLSCLKEKLDLKQIEHFGLVLKLKQHKYAANYIILDETYHLYKIEEKHKDFECLLRFLFIPVSFENLLFKDLNSFNYLFIQVNFKFKN